MRETSKSEKSWIMKWMKTGQIIEAPWISILYHRMKFECPNQFNKNQQYSYNVHIYFGKKYLSERKFVQ